HILGKMIMEYYQHSEYDETPNTAVFSKLLIEEFGADAQKDELQKLKYGVMLFPSHYFSLDLPVNYVSHHFSGSWHENWSEEKNTYKELVNMYGRLNDLAKVQDAKAIIKDVVYNHQLLEIDKVLDQIPLRYIISYLKKKMKQRIGIS
ncbi:MAG: glycosyl transferase, partial [Moheibacter sp.]